MVYFYVKTNLYMDQLGYMPFSCLVQLKVSGPLLYYSKISQNAERRSLVIDLKTTDFIFF